MNKNLRILTKLSDGGLKIKSTELVDIINQFRELESESSEKKYTELQHYDFYKKIKKELEMLESLGLGGLGNISESSYIDSQNKKQKCYELNRDGMLQMLNSESTLVRYKTIEYINELEEENQQLYNIAVSDNDQKQRVSEANRVKWAKKSIYLDENIHDRKSLRKYIREYDLMKLDECIDTVAEMTNKMKGSIKHELLDVAIKELKAVDDGLMKDTIKHTYIKDTAQAGIIILQDVKIGKFKKRIKTLENKAM